MKVKIFNGYVLNSYSLEKKINDFLSGFYKIERINFTYLRDNIILCSYEGETWEEYNTKMENALAATDALKSHYDQMTDSYLQGRDYKNCFQME